MKRAQLLVIGIVVCLSGRNAPAAQTKPADSANGIRISIVLTRQSGVNEREFRVAFRNVSGQPLRVPIGVIPGGARLQPFTDPAQKRHPLFLKLFVRGSDGVTRRVPYSAANQIAGYTEPWIISLRSGESYSVRIPAGSYHLSGSETLAEFLGRPCRLWMELEVRRDECGNPEAGISCRDGKAVSNTLELPVQQAHIDAAGRNPSQLF